MAYGRTGEQANQHTPCMLLICILLNVLSAALRTRTRNFMQSNYTIPSASAIVCVCIVFVYTANSNVTPILSRMYVLLRSTHI